MGNILSTAPNQQTVRIMTNQPALTPARTINSQQQHRIVSVSKCFSTNASCYVNNMLMHMYYI